MFTKLPSIIDVQLEDALSAGRKLVPPLQRAPQDPQVQHVDLVLQEFTVEDSNDESFFRRATDTVHLGVTTISETGTVKTVLNKFGSRAEGQRITFPNKDYPNPILATVDLDYASSTFPRTLSFKIDAVEKDDGTYNRVLVEVQKYLQAYITEELIERGIITAGGWVGIPIPPQLAKFLASLAKGWFDEFIDWLFDVFENEDDLIGSYTRMLTLTDDSFQFKFFSFLGQDISLTGPAPPKGVPFTHIFSGSGGRWRVKFFFQLR